MMYQIVPVDVCIKKYYRGYAEVNCDASDAEIREAMTNIILKYQDRVLYEDADFEIGRDDIVSMDIDHDSAWLNE